MTLCIIWLAIASITALLASIVNMYCSYCVESKYKLEPENKKLRSKYNICFALYHLIVALGAIFLLICTLAIMYSFTIYVFSLA